MTLRPPRRTLAYSHSLSHKSLGWSSHTCRGSRGTTARSCSALRRVARGRDAAALLAVGFPATSAKTGRAEAPVDSGAAAGEPTGVCVFAASAGCRSMTSLGCPLVAVGSSKTASADTRRGWLGGRGRRVRRACCSSMRSLNLAIGLHGGGDRPQLVYQSCQAVRRGVVAGEGNPQLAAGQPRVERDHVGLGHVAGGSQDAVEPLDQ